MKITKLFLLISTIIIVTACSSRKKAQAKKGAVSAVNPTASSSLTVKSSDGIYSPGNEELAAIQTQYKDLTLEKLRLGYSLYAQSACTQCHAPLNIYNIPEAKCKEIIGDMAQRAQLAPEQRDAVYKYVLAIKAAR